MVLIGILMLFYMSFRVGKFGTLTGGGYNLIVRLPDAAGLDTKSPVELAGVEIGSVQRIYLDGYKAKAVLLMKGEMKIPEDSKVVIKSFGILGDKYLSIVPGQSGTFLKTGEEIAQVEPGPDYDQIFSNIQEVAKSLGDVMGEFKGVIGDMEKGSIKESLQNIQVLTRDFKEMVAENKENVRRVVTNAANVSERLGPVADRAEGMIESIQVMVKEIEEGKGTLGLLVKDEKLYNDARDTVATLKNISQEIEEGKGTLGKLVKDDTIYEEARETITNAKQITEGINKGEGTLGKLVKDPGLAGEADKTMKKVQKAAEGVEEITPLSVLGTIFSVLF
jgi:phospholipid/cholesterol/gamma-HCH transport system substrate-binding protein